MLEHTFGMEAAIAYFTRRARQERTRAASAASAEARSAHLELALRLVKVATQAAPPAPHHNDNCLDEVAGALDDAFPVPPSSEFDELLNAIDEQRS
jgi:hypothetical protein